MKKRLVEGIRETYFLKGRGVHDGNAGQYFLKCLEKGIMLLP